MLYGYDFTEEINVSYNWIELKEALLKRYDYVIHDNITSMPSSFSFFLFFL